MLYKLRHCLTAALVSLPAVSLAAPIDTASNWLRSFETLTADFTQISQTGERAEGRMLISRPGKMRLEYQGKDAPLVIVGAGAVAIFDPQSNGGPTQYPLSRTPLGPILARNPNLSASDMIENSLHIGSEVSITAQDPNHPEYGHTEFFFSADSGALTKWIMTSAAGEETLLTFSNIETGMRLGLLPFSASREAEIRKPQK